MLKKELKTMIRARPRLFVICRALLVSYPQYLCAQPSNWRTIFVGYHATSHSVHS